MNMEELWDMLMDNQHKGLDSLRARATISAPVTLIHWHGHHANPEFTEEELPTGTRINVVMASRFGDVGITKDLKALYGYQARIQCLDLEDIKAQTGLLTDIKIWKASDPDKEYDYEG